MSPEDALEELVAGSGSHFSPRVVEALLALHVAGDLPPLTAGGAEPEAA